jgi:hypothetical protein
MVLTGTNIGQSGCRASIPGGNNAVANCFLFSVREYLHLSEIIFVHRNRRKQKFRRISDAGNSGTENSAESRTPELPGQKIPQNFGRWNCRDRKFRRIPNAGTAGTENSTESRTPELPERKIPHNSGCQKSPEQKKCRNIQLFNNK